MLNLKREDDTLGPLLGTEIPSERQTALVFRPLRKVGEGGSAIAFLALRVGPEGQCPSVIKVLRPSLVRRFGDKARMAIQKEAVSLGRLNEQVPPTPFVVRLIDTGAMDVHFMERPLALPWLAVEHVYGGATGTTLSERVDHTLRTTGQAFDTARAARALECMAAGLDAVHRAGVVHRDIKPDNILCCGLGEEELFKVADFGIARAAGIEATFGFIVGTPGYAAPELGSISGPSLGPWSDVFGLAGVVYYLLTGQHYLPVGPNANALLAPVTARNRLLDARGLCAELRGRPDACRAIELALERATANNPAERTQTAQALRAEIAPHLLISSGTRRPYRSREHFIEEGPTVPGEWVWSTEHRSATDLQIRDVAWDVDGRCLAATAAGLIFWDGTSWRDASTGGLPIPRGVRFVRRRGPGRWLIGGDEGTFASYDSGGVHEVVRGDPSMRFDLWSGDPEDMAVLGGSVHGGPPLLLVLVAHRWMRPFSVPEAASISGLSQISDSQWLIAGRDNDGNGYAAIFAPLDREITRLPTEGAGPFAASAGAMSIGLGAAVGAGGAVLWCEQGVARLEDPSGAGDLTCAAIDALGGGWAASAGAAWLRSRSPDGSGRWAFVWDDAEWRSPIVSLLADVGMVLAVASDGSVLRGRSVLGGQ